MNQIQIYRILESQGFSKENAENFIKAVEDNTPYATKSDLLELENRLSSQIQKLEVKVSESINQLYGKLIATVGFGSAVFACIVGAFQLYLRLKF